MVTSLLPGDMPGEGKAMITESPLVVGLGDLDGEVPKNRPLALAEVVSRSLRLTLSFPSPAITRLLEAIIRW